VVLASGESKADAVAAAFGPGARPDPHVPSSYLPEVARELLVLIDPAAAARL
jgi:6-phosphogluconolactonase/glucosamine-6-phosphate isomerase/deaminase